MNWIAKQISVFKRKGKPSESYNCCYSNWKVQILHKRFSLTADEHFREMNNWAVLFPVEVIDSADYLWRLQPREWRATKVFNIFASFKP